MRPLEKAFLGGIVISRLSWIRLLLVAAGIAGAAICGDRACAQSFQEYSYPNPYRAAEAFGHLPKGRMWGSTSAATLDSQGHVWVGERCGKNSCAGSDLDSILEFDSSGKLLKSFGGGLLAVPHSIYFDKAGNIWVTDSGELRSPGAPAPDPATAAAEIKGHVAIKFSPEGKILMTLGKPGVSAEGPDTFREPNAVVEGANGDLFVSDGHVPHKGSARIVKFTKDGKFIKQWGGLGSPSGIFIDANDVMYVSDSQAEWTDPKADRYNPGFAHGVHVGSARDGRVTAFIPMPVPPNGDNAPEGIAADVMGNIYIAETIVKGVWKYTKK